jgi:hypothetical protein
MIRNRTLPALAVVLSLFTPLLAARPVDRLPRLHRAALDGAPVSIEVPSDGRVVSAWTWWDSGETDIAVVTRDPEGRWSETFRFGERDGASQFDPALIADPAGHVYLVFVTRETGAISLAILTAGSETWTPALQLVPSAGRASAPSLRVVGDRLVVAWIDGRSVRMVDVPLVGAGDRTNGVQDGPDGFNPLGEVPVPSDKPEPGDPRSKPPKQ